MNKNILKTRLNSIVHYNIELRNLREAISVTESTKEDIINSIVEFFPFSKGDIISKDGLIYKVGTLEGCKERNGKIEFLVYLLYPQTNYGEQSWRKKDYCDRITIDEIDSYKFLCNTEPKQDNNETTNT